jgi:hypothetical protein
MREDAVIDIRLMLSFRGHHKTKKLRLKLGEAGPLGFIYLLMFAAESKTDGVLGEMDADDIALAADYRGDALEFVDTLRLLKMLDFDGQTYSIHDWEEHNPYAAGADERREHGRKAARARWKKEKGLAIGASTKNQQLSKKNDAPSMNGHCTEHESAMQGAQLGNAPVPIPYPVPVPDSDQTLSINPNAVVVTSRAPATAAGDKKSFDYSNWRPDEPCLNRIRMSDPGITSSFIETQRLDFISHAEDNRIPERNLRSRFQAQVHRNWIRAQQRETNTGPLKTAMPAELRNVPDDQLEAWARARDAPGPGVGETYDEYRDRIALHLKNRGSDGTRSHLHAAASALTVN